MSPRLDARCYVPLGRAEVKDFLWAQHPRRAARRRCLACAAVAVWLSVHSAQLPVDLICTQPGFSAAKTNSNNKNNKKNKNNSNNSCELCGVHRRVGSRRRCVEGAASAPPSRERSAAWDVMGLAEGTAKPEIRRRYRALAAQEHPDRRPPGSDEKQAAARFAALASAYEELMEDQPAMPEAGSSGSDGTVRMSDDGT
ncbi:unnamed protein product, partial [Polarella glacialis]